MAGVYTQGRFILKLLNCNRNWYILVLFYKTVKKKIKKIHKKSNETEEQKNSR